MSKYNRKQMAANANNLAEEQLQPLDRPLLSWLPDESLYSYFARHHRLWGDRTPAETIQAFFGTSNGRSCQEGLRPLDVLVHRTQGRIGEADEILHKHTFMRFYEPFMTERALRGFGPGGTTPDTTLKFPMGLWAGTFLQSHPLKRCTKCVESDLEEFGMTYWHLEHQFPGVWVCLEHGEVLQETSLKRKPHERFLWQLPSENEFDAAPALSNAGLLAKARTFAMMVRHITRLECEPGLGSPVISDHRRSLRSFLRREGLLTDDRKLKISHARALEDLCRRFLSFLEEMRSIREFSSVVDTPEKVRHLISSYLAERKIAKPLDVLALIVWTDTQSRSGISTELLHAILDQRGIGE